MYRMGLIIPAKPFTRPTTDHLLQKRLYTDPDIEILVMAENLGRKYSVDQSAVLGTLRSSQPVTTFADSLSHTSRPSKLGRIPCKYADLRTKYLSAQPADILFQAALQPPSVRNLGNRTENASGSKSQQLKTCWMIFRRSLMFA